MSTDSDYTYPTSWRLRTGDDIPYRLVSRTGTFEDEVAQVTEVYLMEAIRVYSFFEESWPSPFRIGDLLYIHPPRSLPGAIGQITTKSISFKSHHDDLPIDPFAADPDAPAGTYHPIAEVTIQYTTQNDSDSGRDLSANAAGEFISIKSPLATWDSDKLLDTTETSTGVALKPAIQWTIKYSRIEYKFFHGTIMPMLRDALGKVNKKGISVFDGALADTILFTGFDFQERQSWREDKVLQPPVALTLQFLERSGDSFGSSYTHQTIWRKDLGFFDRLLPDGLNPIYDSYDFTELFTKLSALEPINAFFSPPSSS